MDELARILVVDDEDGMRQLLQMLLEKDGYAVEVAPDGTTAEEMLCLSRYQLLITDFKMPDMDGLELLQRARQIHRGLGTILLTGYATVENAVAALRQGVDDYLTKPFDIKDLRQTVARTLRNQRLQAQNNEVLTQLRRANSELRQLKSRLAQEVVSTRGHLADVRSMLKRRARELETLSGVSQTLTGTLDLNGVLRNCLKLVEKEMGVAMASIMLLEPAGEELVVKACIGPAPFDIKGERLRLGEGIAGWVARERQPLLVENVKDAPGFRLHGGPLHRRHYRNASLVCVPLIAKGRLLGVVNVNDKKSGEPFNADDVGMLTTIAGQVAVTIENARLYERLRENAFQTVHALVVTLEAKDTYTSGHSQRVADYAVNIGRQLHLSSGEMDVLRYAGQLHDIGKVGITEDILHKPGPLDADEWTVVKTHPLIGERIIQPLAFLEEVKDVVRNHHERWDGRGYPDGLSGEHTPVLTRILGVADAFDAMVSQRPYRLRPMTADEAVAELHHCKGTQFDPELITNLNVEEAFLQPGGTA